MAYPESVPTKSDEKKTHWEVVSGLVARFGESGSKVSKPLLRIDASTVVCHADPEVDDAAPEEDTEQSPVYRQGDKGPIGVPSGLVFLRFSQGESLSAHKDAIEAAGYMIEKDSPGKPAGWVKHASGSRTKCLTDVERLISIKDIVVVEPQMLMPRQTKSVSSKR